MDIEMIRSLVQTAATWGLQVLGAIAVLIVGLLFARLARRGLRRALERSRLDPALVGFLGSLAYYTVLSVIAIAVLGVVGLETASLITVLGASSLAIGLALQGSLANFASGMMLLVFRPYAVGDFIETGEFQGRVVSLGVFSTEIDTLDHVRIVIPNTYVAERPLENWSSNGIRRLDLALEVAVDSDLPSVRRAIEAALQRDEHVLPEPAPVVGVAEFGDTSARLVVRPWCQHEDYWQLRYEIPERLKDAVEAAGASLPCPQRDLRVRAA